MDLFSYQWFLALGSIVLIDLVLAGDNAVVIAVTANTLPKHQQKKAVLYGTIIAIVVRIIIAIVAIYLLRIPIVKVVGGLALFWIAYKLISSKSGHLADGKETKDTTFFQALILIGGADAIMGIDNAVAIAAAAKDSIDLVVIGLLLSIPIVMWGSLFILKLIAKNPWIVWLGGGLLGYIGGGMIATDVYFAETIKETSEYLIYVFSIVPALIFPICGWLSHRKDLKQA